MEARNEGKSTHCVYQVHSSCLLYFICSFLKRIFNRDALGDRAVKKFSIPSQSKKICAFSNDEQTLIIVTKDGMYFQKAVDGRADSKEVKGIPLLDQTQ